jgi:hypothetical protein
VAFSHHAPGTGTESTRLVFERLFGGGSAGERRENFQMRQAQQRSILDFVLEDAHVLQGQLASRDRQKLDEYLDSVRDIETRIERAERFGVAPNPGVETPAGIPPPSRNTCG